MDNEKLRIENCQLGDLCQISPSRKPIGDDETVTFIGMEDVSGDGKIINHNLLPYSKTKNGLTYFEKNDVLVAKITPCFENGKGACLDNLKTEKGFGSTEFHILRVNNNSVPRYIFYHTQSEKFRRKLAVEMVGSAGQKRVSASAILNYQLSIVHSISEQTAIAAALNDADALITQLEKLIAKKRNIKQGAMQELLKPKEGWEVKKLREIGECIIGLTYSPSNVKKEGILVLRSSNIRGNKLVYEDNVFVNVDVPEKLITQKSDILICVRNGSRNLIGKCAYIDGRGVGETFGAFMSIFRSQFNNFLFHALQSNFIQRQIGESIGATINQLTNKNLNAFEIPFPMPEEQTYIAQILSDMDAEIEALEKKLDKYKMLKQGMMQNLLTGKIRLV